MGGVKKKTKVPIKKESRYKIPTKFNCPACGGQSCVYIRLHRADGSADVSCKGECKSANRFSVLRLEEPVDAFFKYYEECTADRRINTRTLEEDMGMEEQDSWGGIGDSRKGQGQAAGMHANDPLNVLMTGPSGVTLGRGKEGLRQGRGAWQDDDSDNEGALDAELDFEQYPEEF